MFNFAFNSQKIFGVYTPVLPRQEEQFSPAPIPQHGLAVFCGATAPKSTTKVILCTLSVTPPVGISEMLELGEEFSKLNKFKLANCWTNCGGLFIVELVFPVKRP